MWGSAARRTRARDGMMTDHRLGTIAAAWARRCAFMASLFAVLFVLDVAHAQGQPPVPAAPAAKRHVLVGTVPIAPFIVKRDTGEWTGISIELWKRVARELNLDYEIREYDRKA